MSDSSRTGGSGTVRKSGSENTSHQTPTLTNESRTAAVVSGRPNVAGLRIQARLISSRMPPPMNPIAKPAVETRSMSRGAAMWGSSES